MSPNGVYFEVPFINNPRGVEFILTNPSGVNYDMFLYEGYETEIASAVTKKETENIPESYFWRLLTARGPGFRRS